MKWLIIVPALFVVIIVAIGVYLQPNDFRACAAQPSESGECAKADAIVVVSGGDTPARTAAGIELYKNGWAGHLILSGAASDKTGPSNAAAMRHQAESAGVPTRNILVDETSLNTKQNAANTKSIIHDGKFRSVILVTSGYHQRRASLEFNKLADDGTIVRNYPVTNDSDWSFWWWMTPRGWWLAGAELAKIVAFYMGISQ